VFHTGTINRDLTVLKICAEGQEIPFCRCVTILFYFQINEALLYIMTYCQWYTQLSPYIATFNNSIQTVIDKPECISI
jgi:hypothetical protein